MNKQTELRIAENKSISLEKRNLYRKGLNMRTKKKQIVFRLANSDARIIDFLAKERFMKKSPFFNYCVTQFVNDLFNNGNFSDRNFVRNKQTLISNYSSSTYSSKYYCKLSEGNTKALNWLARNNIFYSSLKFKDIVAFAITQQIKKVDYIKNLNIEDILVSSKNSQAKDNRKEIIMEEYTYYSLTRGTYAKNQFFLKDWEKSGISQDTILDYVDKELIYSGSTDNELWRMEFLKLKANQISSYYTIRYNTDLKKNNKKKGKYERPYGEPSRLFRPLHLNPESLESVDDILIITEGEKKAIKATQHGFPTIALLGVWCWKMTPVENDDSNLEVAEADIIPDLRNINFSGKHIYLCFDNDMWEKPQVKDALYKFALYLTIEKKAVVHIIYLPKTGEKLGLDDYLNKYGAQEFRKLIDKAEIISVKKIQQKLSGKKPLPKFPLNVFSEPIKETLMSIQSKIDAPMEYIAPLLIASTSILMLGKYELKVTDTWTENPIIWLCIVGNPSHKKTPCIKIFKDLIINIQRSLDEEYKEKLNEYNKKMASYKKALKLNNSFIEPNEADKPEKPDKLLLMSQNVTIEALCMQLKKNSSHGRLITILVDEIAEFLNGLGQYKGGKNSDLQLTLQAWSYDKYYTIQRASRDEDITIPLGFSIIGTIQPKVLLETMFPKGIDSTDGFPQRWLYSTTDYVTTGIISNQELDLGVIKRTWNIIFNTEDKMTYVFSKEAQTSFERMYKKLNSIINNEESVLMSTYLSKMLSYLLRFSLIFHCLDFPRDTTISKETLEKAYKMTCYYIKTYKSVIVDLSEINILADKAWEYINMKNLKEITPTQLKKVNYNKYYDADGVLKHLANKGLGRLAKSKNGGYKFIVYRAMET